jgi:hypothetical protein
VEVFPTWTEKAQEVARCLLKKIIPQFAILVPHGSNNGPAFVAEMVQLMAKGIGMTGSCIWPIAPRVQEKWSI